MDDAVGTVSVLPQELGRVILNLLGNAFDALVEAGTQSPVVQVATQRIDDHVEIRVSDNGPGIPDDVQSKIFEPFFTTKPTGQGTGLGLSMSYDIITKGHGGVMLVESEPGAGAVFIIRLPIEPETA